MHFPRVKHLNHWADLDDLTPIQNYWLRTFTKPSIAVDLPSWGKQQPRDFGLEYLLQHAVKNRWDLTKEGWSKAAALGLLDTPLTDDNDAEREDDECWMTHSEAVTQLLLWTAPRFTEGSLKTRLSKMAGKGQIKTNGEKRRNRRFAKSGINSLELQLRNKDLKQGEVDGEDWEDWED